MLLQPNSWQLAGNWLVQNSFCMRLRRVFLTACGQSAAHQANVLREVPAHLLSENCITLILWSKVFNNLQLGGPLPEFDGPVGTDRGWHHDQAGGANAALSHQVGQKGNNLWQT